MGSLTKVVYRELLHAAQQFDRHASLRALVSSNLMQRPLVPETNTRLPYVEQFNRYLLTFLGHKSFYLPRPDAKPMAELVREHYRSVDPVSSDSSGQRSKAYNGNDTALLVLKALNDKLAMGREVGIIVDVVSPAKKLKTEIPPTQEELAHAAKLEKVMLVENLSSGIFLLSHPLLSGTFSRTVIVLTQHSNRSSRGFIVNVPTRNPLMKAFKVHPRIMRAFGSSKVRSGGPVHTENAEMLHGVADFGGERVANSNFTTPQQEDALFVGIDLETAARAVDDQLAKQSDVVFFNGVSTWIAGQLENEMARGTWVAVRAPLSLALNAKRDLWSEMMAGLGGEYEEFSRMPVVDDDEAPDDEEE